MKEEQYWITIRQWTNIIFSDLFESNHVRNINLNSIELQETETKGCILIDHKFWGKIRITYSVEEYSLTVEAINICKIPLEWIDDFKKELQDEVEEYYKYLILDPDGTLHSIFTASYNYDEIITEGALHSYRDFEKTMEQLYPTEIIDQSVSYPLKESYSCHCTCKETQSSRTVLPLRKKDISKECREILLEQCSKCGGYFLRCDYYGDYGRYYYFPVRGPGEGICLKELGFSYIFSHITDCTEEVYEY